MIQRKFCKQVQVQNSFVSITYQKKKKKNQKKRGVRFTCRDGCSLQTESERCNESNLKFFIIHLLLKIILKEVLGI